MARKKSTQGRALQAQRNPIPEGESNAPVIPVRLSETKRNEKGQVVVRTELNREQLEEQVIGGLCEITGTKDFLVADRLLHQVGNSLIYPRADEKEVILRAAAAIADHAPKNGAQAMLATQMIATHDAVCMFMMRATLKDQTPYGIDSNTDRAARLMRVFMDQVELMQKLKGHTSQQRVTVEHVHVHEGGQAIVGAVAGSASRGRGKNHDEQ